MKVRKFRIIVVFIDNGCERYNASEFYFKDNVFTIFEDNVKWALRADCIKDITIY